MISLIHLLDEKCPQIDVSSDDPLLYVPMDGKSFTQNHFGGCGAGIGNLAICYDGTVFPCRRLPIGLGNVKDVSLIDIISSRILDCFYDRKEFFKGKCGVCEYRDICGGCRAAAYAFTNDYLNPDPQCWMVPEEGGE